MPEWEEGNQKYIFAQTEKIEVRHARIEKEKKIATYASLLVGVGAALVAVLLSRK